MGSCKSDLVCIDAMDKYYIRFGEIPENERSVNFMKMKLVENEDFTLYMSWGDDRETAWWHASKRPFEEVLEQGVSVFEYRKGFPVADTASLAQALQRLLSEARPIDLVTGKRVGTGQDGEPLLVNVKIVKQL